MRRTVLIALLAGTLGALVATPVAVYASHQFSDVPNSNQFHDDIDWLADAGVTQGCGGSSFCPESAVTREQMAAFLHRLSDNQVVDAGMLEGLTTRQIAPRAAFRNEASVSFPGGGFGLGQYIDVPASGGILLLSGGIDGHAFGSDDVYSCEFMVDGVSVSGSRRLVRLDGGGGVNLEEDCVTTGAVFGVSSGQHLFELFVDSATSAAEFRNFQMWALWVPFSGCPANQPTCG